MFEQNNHATFFDAEWMFGVKGGFDVVIANPPYKIVSKDDELKPFYDSHYSVARGGKRNLFHLFFERGIKLAKTNGALTYITPDTYFSGNDTEALREYFVKNIDIQNIVHYTEKEKVFENVTQAVAVIVLIKQQHGEGFHILSKSSNSYIDYKNITKSTKYIFKATDSIIERMKRCTLTFGAICEGYQGDVNLSLKRDYFVDYMVSGSLPLVRGIHIAKYSYEPGNEYCLMAALSRNHVKKNRIVFQEVANMGLSHRVKGTLINNVICGHSCNILFSKDNRFDNRTILSVLNSKAVNYYFKYFNQTNHVPIGEIRKIPFPAIPIPKQNKLTDLVNQILSAKKANPSADTSALEQQIDLLVYHLYGLTYDEVLIVDPATPITREEYERTS